MCNGGIGAPSELVNIVILFVIIALSLVVARCVLILPRRHLLLLVLRQFVLLVLVLLLAVHELIEIVLQVHLLIRAVAYFCLALAQ